MLYWSLAYLVMAIAAGALGFGVLHGLAASAAQMIFWVFIVVLAVSIVLGLAEKRRRQR